MAGFRSGSTDAADPGPFDVATRLRSQAVPPGGDVTIRTVTLPPHRVATPVVELAYFVHTGSAAMACVVVADNDILDSVSTVTARGRTWEGAVGLELRVQFASPMSVVGPIAVRILQANQTADGTAVVLPAGS